MAPRLRGRALPLLLLLALAAAYWAVAALGPDVRGWWQDDGIYLTTARSLAQGTGYRHIENPGEPLQTKYPVLYPAALALVSAAWQDPRAIFLPGALGAAAFVIGTLLYARRVLELPVALVGAAGALAALSPSTLSLVRFTLSDLPYAGIAVLALLCLDERAVAASTPARRLAWLAAGSLLVAAAVLTRGFGLTLAAAAVLTPLLARRFRDAVLSAAVILAGVAPWWIWQARAVTRNGPLARVLLLRQDLGQANFLPGSIAQTARVAWQNLIRTAFGIGRFELALPQGLVAPDVAGHLLVDTLFLLVLAGFAATLRRGLRTVHVYFLCYGALMLAWPFEPYRFLAAWTPFLLVFFLVGVGAAVSKMPRSPASAAAVPAFAIAILFLAEDVRVVGSSKGAFRVAGSTAPVLAEDDAAMDSVVRHTRPEDVVASVLPARVFLLTGRKGVCLWHDEEPHALYAGPERTWMRFYEDGDPFALVHGQAARDLVGAYREAGVRYVLLSRQVAPRGLEVFFGEHPAVFPTVWTSPGGTQRLLAFRPERTPEFW